MNAKSIEYMIKIIDYTFKSLFESLINVLFPNKCEFCGSPLEDGCYICEICKSDLEYIDGIICQRCGAPLYTSDKSSTFTLENVKDKNVNEYSDNSCFHCNGYDFSFKRNESVYLYSGKVRELIHMYKFGKRWRFYKYFAEEIVKLKSQYIEKFDYIVAVPLTKKRLKSRGYNQSSLIAEDISKRTKITYLKDALKRRGNSKPQSLTYSVDERYKNMKDRINVNIKYAEIIKDKNILLLDDILTTGITASRCADAFYVKKVKNVNLLTIARTLR